MSEGILALARRGYEAFNRHDLDSVFELYDEEIEVHDPPEFPGTRVHRGHDEARADIEDTMRAFEGFSVIPECYVELGDDELLVLVRYRGTGAESGAEVEAEMAHIWTFRDGKVVCLRQYVDRKAAFEAAGLSAESK